MDRAYEDDATRRLAAQLGYQPVVPPKSNRRRPWTYDRARYRRRNEVERFCCRLKRFRRIAFRSDKLDQIYLAAVHLVLIYDMLLAMSTGPSRLPGQSTSASNPMTRRSLLTAAFAGMVLALGILGLELDLSSIESAIPVQRQEASQRPANYGAARSETAQSPKPAHEDANTAGRKVYLNQRVIDGMTTIVCSDDDEVRPELKLAVETWAMAWAWKQFTDSNGSAGGPLEYFEPSAGTDTCASNTEAKDVHVYVRRVPREGGVYWRDKQESPPRKLFTVSAPEVDDTYHTNHYSMIALSDKGEVDTSTLVHELGHVLGLSDYKTCDELHRTGTALVDPDPTDQHYALMYNASDRECRPQNQEAITDRDFRDLHEAYHVGAITKVRVPWYPVGSSKDSRAMNPAINGNVLSFTIHWDDGIAEAAHNASQVAVFGYYTGIGWKLLSSLDLPTTTSSLPMVRISAMKETPPADPVHNPSPVAAWPTKYKVVGLTSGDIRWEGMRIGQSGKPHTWNFDRAPASASNQTEGDPTFLVARLEQNGQVVSSPPSLSASISPRYCWTGGTLSVSVRAAGGALDNPKVRLVGASTWRDANGQTEFSVKCDSSDVVQWVGVESDHGTSNITDIPRFVHTPPKALVLAGW